MLIHHARRAKGMVAALTLLVALPVMGQWSAVQRLNEAGEASHAIKNGRVAVDASGDFHIVYKNFNTDNLRYRRFAGGSLTSAVTATSNGFYNPEIAVAGNGDIHIVFEDWSGSPEVGWVKSTDNGASFSTRTKISNSGTDCKFPFVAHYGPAGSAEVVHAYHRTDEKSMRYQHYNGSSWSPSSAGYFAGCDSEYYAPGMCRSHLDGSVFRTYGRSIGGNVSVCYRQFTGSWGPEVVVDQGGFFARQSIAVNQAGQVMVVWNRDSRDHSRLYTPGSGWGPVYDFESETGFGNVIAIPGSNDFYIVYTKDASHVRGRRYSGGGWLGYEDISLAAGQAHGFTPEVRVAAGPDGALFVVWERWVALTPSEDGPQFWYSYQAGSPPGPQGTLQGVVRDQYGAGVSGVLIAVAGENATISSTGGAYSMLVDVGTYTVTASKSYYSGHTQYSVPITDGGTTVRDFAITGQAPANVSSFVVTPDNTSNDLQWTNPSSGQFSATRIVWKTGSYPTHVNDGSVLIEDGASPASTRSTSHTGLTNGVTYYYRAFAYFQDASRFYASGTNASGAPALQVDFDHDGDVDQEDFGHMQVCLSGLAVPQNDQNCQEAKTDADTDVDEFDLADFLGCLSGAGVPAATNCLD